MNSAKALEDFKIGEIALGGFKSLLDGDVNPNRREESFEVAAQRHPPTNEKISGIYFWVMSWNDAKYAIYLGRSENIVGRLSNYTAKFQPKSPNNFKIRCFRHYMEQEFKGAMLLLYYKAFLPGELKEREREYINALKPLINERGVPMEHQKEIEDKYRSVYESIFRAMGFENKIV